ncbi:DUF3098 domain-containing protein [candidate division WOR-3 bacterium]|nr:DUF3098 domain-containing protein [candidate division WOR-3 bacterium]
MAKKNKKDKQPKKQKKEETKVIDVTFKKKNFLFFGIGLATVIVGFILLAAGDIVAAPLLLMVGYLVFFPLGILSK